MDRRSLRYGYLLAFAAALVVVSAAGCRSISTAIAYMIKGTDIDPEFPGLKGKKVVVVCRPMASLDVQNAGAEREIAKQIGILLKAQVPKITVIDQQKVTARADENPSEDYPEIGKAFNADMVVAVDLARFSTLEGQTLWRGRADATVKVYDLSKEKKGEVVWEKTIPPSLYPPNMAIPMADQSEGEFRRAFIGVLANQIGRNFYAYDRFADMGQDVEAALK
jgi:hypothetical protein